MDISFVIITLNDAGRLPRALSSAALMSAKAGLDYDIWVVDNGSKDNTSQVLDAFSSVLGFRLQVIKLSQNFGTTYPRNLALQRSKGRLLCVMDSDAELLDDSLDEVKRFLEAFPEVGIAAPRIIMPDGSTYNSVKMLPTLADKLGKLPGIFTRHPTLNQDWYPDFPFEQMRCVDTAISCCWFFRRDVLERVGPLDEKIFYAPEDVDWCLRCWKEGLAVVYYPAMRVLHHTRQISHKKPLSRTSLSHFKGILYYLGKHGYCFDRKPTQKRYVEPMERVLTPRLAAWEQSF